MQANKVMQIDALRGFNSLLENSVDCIITSPPYWFLRIYDIPNLFFDGNEECEHVWNEYTQKRNEESKKFAFCEKCGMWEGQLGLEPHPSLFIEHLVEIFSSSKRVLKDSGSLWVNLGDAYNGGKAGQFNLEKRKVLVDVLEKPLIDGIPERSQLGISYDFARSMIRDGWCLKNTIIWHKPNQYPSGINRKFTPDFEWFFWFVKTNDYFYEQQFEPLKETSKQRAKYSAGSKSGKTGKYGGYGSENLQKVFDKVLSGELSYRNKRAVWSINTKSYHGSHFATYPIKLMEVPIDATCPEFVCKKCGFLRQRIYKKTGDTADNKRKYDPLRPDGIKLRSQGFHQKVERKIIGLTDCGCGVGFKSGVVLDPFGGSGTTAAAAKRMRRDYIIFEPGKSYGELAEKRLNKSHRHKRINW